ncbi:chromosomal replication initiator protein DnaA [Pasteuria penetrans]|uniref:chromosomal replication initiator protein DnaA n=1 Tax=Pasteuria penetrans TaxID=86005 RepID=UPI0011F06529|nr:chromosomal replication initiator protein DnaA [Pasteuria penetrans]
MLPNRYKDWDLQELWNRTLKRVKKHIPDTIWILFQKSNITGRHNDTILMKMPQESLHYDKRQIEEGIAIAEKTFQFVTSSHCKILVEFPPVAGSTGKTLQGTLIHPLPKEGVTKTQLLDDFSAGGIAPTYLERAGTDWTGENKNTPLPRKEDPTVRRREGISEQPPPSTSGQKNIPGNRGGNFLGKDQSFQFNPNYNFSTFIVGKTNELAYAATCKVAESPAGGYNPLVLCGGVGLGKTHLMHALAQHILSKEEAQYRIVYISSEDFTNHFISTLMQKERTSEFRDRYRNVDILLVDDVQFLGRKEQTQEEFFHTFNALHSANKQIVLSTDRRPHAISALEARLRSRFASGLLVDIEPPDYETRLAILRRKAEIEKVSVEDNILEYIAERVDNNIRELEGVWISVVARSHLEGTPVTIQSVNKHLSKCYNEPSRSSLSLSTIQKTVCNYYSLNINDLTGKSRAKPISVPRQIAMYLARELTDHSLLQIGHAFGGRNHATVVHAHEKISKMLQGDSQLQRIIQSFSQKITQHNN